MGERRGELDLVVLAGGRGTRLQGVLPALPKCLAPVRGRPFLQLLLDLFLSMLPIGRVILALGYRAEQVIAAVRPLFWDRPLFFSIEEEELGTGGALKRAVEEGLSEEFVVCNGDALLDVDFPSLYAPFAERDALLSLCCVAAPSAARGGSYVELEEGSQRLLSFQELPGRRGGMINGGVYLMRRSIASLFPTTGRFSLERELFPLLVGGRAYGCPCSGFFIDIGTPLSYAEAQRSVEGERCVFSS